MMAFAWDADKIVEDMLRKADETIMPLPAMETEPHLLMSKVRKQYFEYLIKLLSINYENYQMLLDKNIHLPSAIWRCAKQLEMNAVRASMVVDLYRKSVVSMIKDLKSDTKKGKLHDKLFDCLQQPYGSEKKTQTTLGLPNNCTCQCTCNGTKKRRRSSTSPKHNGPYTNIPQTPDLISTTKEMSNNEYKIPVVLNTFTDPVQSAPQASTAVPPNKLSQCIRMSTESLDSGDQIMLQMEQLFKTDSNDDDIFEGNFDTIQDDVEIQEKRINNVIVDQQADKIKSLDERLAMLESSGVLVMTKETVKEAVVRQKKRFQTKWLCELYFQRLSLFEKLDEIRDCNRKKHTRVRNKFTDLFGEDSDDEQVLSPLDETPEFVLSCKERVAPWIVKILTPHYVKGRIRGKALFKSVAKHLIKLIYQCSRYPSEYEVHSFVTDFLKGHPIIRCEADFQQFRINNI